MGFKEESRTQLRHRVNSRPRSEEPLEETRFEWYRFEDKFEWKQKRVTENLDLLFLWPKDGGIPTKAYEPLEQTELFDEFSRLDSLESMLGFANQYGWLGLDHNYGPSYPEFFGEPQTTWSRHVTDMRIVLEIWDLIQAPNIEALKKFIHWKERYVEFGCRIQDGKIIGCSTRPKTNYRFETIAGDNFGTHFTSWKRGDIIRPAKLFVANLVNKALWRQISSVAVVGKDGSLKPYYCPTCLLSALWLQVYQQVTGQTRFRRCGICGNRMDVTNNRSHKRVHDRCSHRVRMQRYRG